jgi:hypothetical protein
MGQQKEWVVFNLSCREHPFYFQARFFLNAALGKGNLDHSGYVPLLVIALWGVGKGGQIKVGPLVVGV